MCECFAKLFLKRGKLKKGVGFNKRGVAQLQDKMSVQVKEEESVEDIRCFSITNGSGVVLKCISLGATVTEVKLADG